jgi:hypothetical protein
MATRTFTRGLAAGAVFGIALVLTGWGLAYLTITAGRSCDPKYSDIESCIASSFAFILYASPLPTLSYALGLAYAKDILATSSLRTRIQAAGVAGVGFQILLMSLESLQIPFQLVLVATYLALPFFLAILSLFLESRRRSSGQSYPPRHDQSCAA